MTASQRLKELAASWGDDISFTPAQVLALASLVEAAERHHDAGLIPKNETLWNLEAALAALEEALK